MHATSLTTAIITIRTMPTMIPLLSTHSGYFITVLASPVVICVVMIVYICVTISVETPRAITY